MIRYLYDPANAITIGGLILTILGIHAALQHQFEIAVIAVLWALLADHFDGFIAKRLSTRLSGASQIGKQLDALTDIVSGAVFPSILVLLLGKPSWFALFTALTLCVTAALRLSYFNTFGLAEGGRFVGVPVTYNMPAIAFLFALSPLISKDQFPIILTLIIFVLAILHVSPFHVPPVRGIMYLGITLFVIVMTIVLGMRII